MRITLQLLKIAFLLVLGMLPLMYLGADGTWVAMPAVLTMFLCLIVAPFELLLALAGKSIGGKKP